MPRRIAAPIILLVAAALSFAAVFAVQRIESAGGPLAQPWASTWFSPNGDGHDDIGLIRFNTRRAERVTVTIVDARGSIVRTIASDEFVDGPVELEWDGLTDSGDAAPEGEYTVRIRRSGDTRSYSPTKPMVIDLTPPNGRLDRATWEGGELRGLALLEDQARLAVLAGDGEELAHMNAFRPNPAARSAQPEGRHMRGTIPIRFTVPVDRSVHELDDLSFVAIDRAGNRLDLLDAPDAPTIRVIER